MGEYVLGESQRQKLNDSSVEVFGTMYYTPIELLPDMPAQEQWNLEEQYVRTVIEYRGPHTANMEFFFPKSLAVNIAGGFLGVDDESLSDEQTIDTMREATNMIIGNFLGRIDPDGACKLGVPSAEVVSDFSPDNCPTGHVVAFMSDFGFLWMMFD